MRTAQRGSEPAIKRTSRDGELRLSPAQLGLWFQEMLEPGKAFYNIPVGVRLRGMLKVEALEDSLNEIVRRHEVLRTIFPALNGKPAQKILPFEPRSLKVIDLTHLPLEQREAEAMRLAEEEVRKPFDIARGPLMRASAFRLGDQDHLALLVIHHIISDGWSRDVILGELSACYESFAAGRSPRLPELPIHYADFANWQYEALTEGKLDKQVAYWKQRLAGRLPVLDLPSDRPRPAARTFQGAKLSFLLALGLSKSLKALSRREGATLFMTLLAAFKVLLHRYTGEEDILVGTPIAGRNRLETEGLIGLFINTLVLRTDLSGNPSFRQLLAGVRKLAWEAFANQDVPFEKLVDELRPERNASYSPVFQAMLVLGYNPNAPISLAGLTVTPVELDSRSSQFDLTISMADTDRGLEGFIEYNTDIFDEPRIKRMAVHFENILRAVTLAPEQPISDLPLMGEQERHQLIVEWNQTEASFPGDKGFHHLFEAQAERTPDATALVFKDEQLSYRELNARANQLAHYLQGLGVGPDDLIGVYVDRSPELTVAMLGILKAGGAYMPLDPRYPADRLAFMLDDARVPVLLSVERLAGQRLEHQARVILLDRDWRQVALCSTDNTASRTTPGNLAYVIYTSGSTGRPKGVLIGHGGLTNLSEAQLRAFDLKQENRVLQFSSLGFDASIFEVAMALRVGAALCLADEDSLLPGQPLIDLMRQRAVTNVTLPPSALAAMPEEKMADLATIVVAGEACSADLVERWAGGRRFFNAYGPTEATVWSTLARCFSGDKPDIGRAIDNTQVYVLDRFLQPVPVGVPGELHIGGVGLARGYLNRADLTAERFIPNPFASEPGSRLYKTGDLACLLTSGRLDFLGRIDHQVKIRGFRIELGEIEAVLDQHPAVRQSVVADSRSRAGGMRLIGYFVASATAKPDPAELRSFLRERLPEYMVPAAFIELESFPLTPNGKIDRKALPAGDDVRQGLGSFYVAPQNEIERRIASIWQELLQVEKVGMNDSFFDLGGHSLLLAQLHSKLQETFDQEFSMVELFQYPTVSSLAVRLGGAKTAEASGAEGGNTDDGLDQRKERLKRRLQQGRRVSDTEAFE
jgi:amino acid adenylation domain-containing protein